MMQVRASGLRALSSYDVYHNEAVIPFAVCKTPTSSPQVDYLRERLPLAASFSLTLSVSGHKTARCFNGCRMSCGPLNEGILRLQQQQQQQQRNSPERKRERVSLHHKLKCKST